MSQSQGGDRSGKAAQNSRRRRNGPRVVSNTPVRNVVTFYAPKMGISLRRAPETGFVVVTKATPALRNGHVAPGDRVTEAIGVDLSHPITAKEFRSLDARLRNPASRPWPTKLTVEREPEPHTRKPPNDGPIGNDVGEARTVGKTGRIIITATEAASPIEEAYLTRVEELKRASGADRQGTWTVRRPDDNKNWTAKATTEISAQCNVDYALRVSGPGGVEPQDWLLDTASTIMLTRRRNGLKFIHRAKRGIRIASAGGVTTATERGYHEGWDKWFWIHPDEDGLPVNILAFGML